ncbi:MAG: DUF1302 domain-containing protein [Sulfuritalea sp.]|nr:DUF1302 domain-containing protein [Sulfuritalea sp.]
MKKTYLKIKPLALAIAALGATFATPAAAFKFEMENGITGSFDSTISFGMQTRMQSTDKSIIGRDNGGTVATVSELGVKSNGPGAGGSANPDFNYLQTDDGNLNYKKHDIVSAVIKGTHELFLTQKGNWSALGRFTWSTDLRADNTRRTPLHDDAEDAMEKNISLLDFWVAKEFRLGDNSAKIKVGNQVINWGEDIFIIGGINAVNALDLRKIHIPGVQLKEVFIPAPMISFTSGLGNGFSTEAYYQFRWNSFKFDPAGTYWSAADFLGKGGKRGAFIPSSVLALPPGTVGDFDPKAGRTMAFLNAAGTVLPVERDEPDDLHSGQYGINFRYKPAEGDTEFAAYYIRYHDKIPFVGFRYNPATPNIIGTSAVEQYQEDRSLYGISMNTKLGDWAIGAELSYRPRDSVAIDPTVPLAGPYTFFGDPRFGTGTSFLKDGFKDEKKYQAHLTGFYLMPQSITAPLGAAEGFFLGEMAVTRYPDLDLSGAVPYLLNNYTLPDKTSWGYVAEFGLTYANIFQSGWTMSPILDFYHDVQGTSPTALPFVEGRKAVALNLNFDYHNEWKAGIGYVTYWGGGNMNMLRDRDVVTMSVSRTF